MNNCIHRQILYITYKNYMEYRNNTIYQNVKITHADPDDLFLSI